MHRRLALMRRPSSLLADGLVTHIERSTDVDPGLALQQWRAYRAAMQAHGWHVVEAPAANGCPDGVFIEDQVFVYSDVAVLCRSGAPERRAEQVGLTDCLTALGYRVVSIESPGTLDGGDILKHDGRVWVGCGGESVGGMPGRSNTDGIAQLRRAVVGLGASVDAVPVSKALHLKSAVTALPNGTIVGWLPAVDDPARWGRFLAVDEEPGAHVVLLGGDAILMSAAAPATAERYRRLGLNVTTVDISEFEKLEGCVTCLSVRLRG